MAVTGTHMASIKYVKRLIGNEIANMDMDDFNDMLNCMADEADHSTTPALV